MKIYPTDEETFTDYAKPLRALERAFKRAGVRVSFLALKLPFYGKTISIKERGREYKTVCIEGDSPAQAVKDVAGAVKL